MLQKKDNRAAGELEGAKAPLVIGLIAIKNVRYGLFDERSEIFRENLFSQNVAFLKRAKKSKTFLTRCKVLPKESLFHIFVTSGGGFGII